MKNVSRWSIRWFVALWVFAGFMMGFGAAMWKFTSGDARLIGGWIFWISLIIYFIVSGTLGRGYLELVRELK